MPIQSLQQLIEIIFKYYLILTTEDDDSSSDYTPSGDEADYDSEDY